MSAYITCPRCGRKAALALQGELTVGQCACRARLTVVEIAGEDGLPQQLVRFASPRKPQGAGSPRRYVRGHGAGR